MKNSRKKIISVKSMQYRTFLVSFIIPSLIFTCTLFLFLIRQTLASNQKDYNNTLNVLSAHLINNIKSDMELSLSYLFDENISDFYTYLSYNDYSKDIVKYNQYLNSYTRNISIYMTILNENILGVGYIPCSYNTDAYFYLKKYNNLNIYTDYEYENSNWYKQMSINSHSVIFTKDENYAIYQDANILSIVRTVKNVDKNQILGYIIIDISMDFIYNLLDELSIGKNSGIILISPKNEFLFSTNEILSPCSALLNNQTKKITYENKTYDIYSLMDKNYGFTFFFLSSRKDVLESYKYALLYVFAFYLSLSIFSIVIFKNWSKKLAVSINPILNTMEKYNAGDAQVQCDTSLCTVSEIETISRNLNAMINKINLHIDIEYKMKLEQKKAEFRALQAEINPHFLYNILNIFITLNRLGDRIRLENSIISLSSLFRYSCKHNYSSSILKEFNFIQDYLYLQQIRFDDRLSFQISIEPGLEEFAIPKLLIQPLIENAIIHGMEPSDKPIHISLAAFKDNNINFSSIIIYVSNTGIPYIEKEVLFSNKRIGLNNVKERLSFYSPSASFVIRGGSNKLTECFIIIPL